MKQQTAVEWLWNLSQTKELQASDFQQALAMEKEQIMKALDRGFDEGSSFPEDITLNNAEQYYNETYGK
jgi:hypothetical protein